MLALCMSVGLLAAMVRKSFKLRRAMHERDRAEAEAESVARHDALTGLANRRRFRDALDARLRHAPETSAVAVLLVDLDRFKPVNDVHGHAAGDAVLCAAAERLCECAPADAVVARLDGDEFAILVDVRGDPESLGRLAQAIIAALSRPVAWAQDRLEIGATVGVVVATAESRTAEALLHAADVAMGQGKREGRGVSRFFHPEMGEALRVRARLEAELRLGIGRGEIAPFYQPVVSLPDRSLIGFEVLARWHHPTQGLLVPDAFIPLAEATGLIDDLTWSLMRQACGDARSWPTHLQLAINISPLQLQDCRCPSGSWRSCPRPVSHRADWKSRLPRRPLSRISRQRGRPSSPSRIWDPDRPRRFRDGLFEPLLPARAAIRQAQDRPELRDRDSRRDRAGQARGCDHCPEFQPRPPHHGRGHRDRVERRLARGTGLHLRGRAITSESR